MRFLAILIAVALALLTGCASTATPRPTPSNPPTSEVAEPHPGATPDDSIVDTIERELSLIANIVGIILAAAGVIGIIFHLSQIIDRGLDFRQIICIVALVGLLGMALFLSVMLMSSLTGRGAH
ncbi:MAG: hypothetical protein ACT4NY_27600 [Pseudonocardiales bacterium]